MAVVNDASYNPGVGYAFSQQTGRKNLFGDVTKAAGEDAEGLKPYVAQRSGGSPWGSNNTIKETA